MFGTVFDDVDTVHFTGPCILQIKRDANITIGKGFRVHSGNRTGSDTFPSSKITVMEGATLKIGNNSGMANTVLWCRERIEIGDYVNIGTGCFIMDNNFHSTNWQIRMSGEENGQIATAPVIIKSHAFIGAHCIINKGVTIGEKSMVAAGSVVVKDVPDGELWGGNPAKYIKRIEA
jgi:acetyltransferase-like isoleucine patch superfamily enzyme